MSWYRQIKTFYTTSINMFFFIIWSIVSTVFLGNKVDYRLYFVSLASAFLLQFIISKAEGKSFPKIIALLAGGLLTFAVSRGVYFIVNSAFIFFILYITNAMELEDVNYDAYKARARNGLVFLLFLGALLPLVDIALSKSILKFYIMYLISNIIVMREARSYYYKVRNPRSLVVNVLISLFVLGLSVDIVFEKLLVIIKYIMSIIEFAVNAFIELLGFVLAKPMLFAIAKLRELLLNGTKVIMSIKESPAANKKSPSISIPLEDPTASIWLYNVVKIVTVAAILIAVFIIISRFVSYYGSKDTALEERREKINRKKALKESFIKKLIKNLSRPRDLRGQTLNIYRKFEEKTFEKGIFKKHMTARQLENVTKAYVENPESLSSLTSIYNEAKFSKHQVDEEKLRLIKEDFNKIRKQL